MSELVVILNALILSGVVVSAILAVHCEKLLSSVIALGVTGIFTAAEFLLLHAPDVAICLLNGYIFFAFAHALAWVPQLHQ